MLNFHQSVHLLIGRASIPDPFVQNGQEVLRIEDRDQDPPISARILTMTASSALTSVNSIVSSALQDSTYCYLHMTSARIAAMDFFDQLEGPPVIGVVEEDGMLYPEFTGWRSRSISPDIEIPLGMMPPDPDDGDSKYYSCPESL